MVTHIARWDLDKTYLRTEFDSLRDLVKTALERPDQKRTNPGASTLLREMVRAGIRVHILSGSPEQMRRNLEDKLRLDGILWDSLTLKPNLQNLLRLRFRAVRDQLGYKLPALLRARASMNESGEAEGVCKETLFGDDAEADAFVYSLYADLLAGRVDDDVIMRVLQRGRVYDDVVAEAMDAARTLDHADIVERILIHLEAQTPPDDFRIYGSRVVPFYNYLQAAFVLFEDGRLPRRRRGGARGRGARDRAPLRRRRPRPELPRSRPARPPARAPGSSPSCRSPWGPGWVAGTRPGD